MWRLEVSIDKQVRDLLKLEKNLRGIKILVVARKDGTIKVKWGKKLDLLTVPSKEWGNEIKMEFDAVINRKANMIREAMIIVRGGVEQMNLFKKDKDDGRKGRIQQGGEQLQSSADVDSTGTERETYDSAGVDRGTGEQPDAGGPKTGD
jgi:hypothetical protein